MFREGRPGVSAGTTGWLFSSEELYRQPGEAHNVAANLAAVLRFANTLKAENIGLLLVPVPAKARIHSHALSEADQRRAVGLRRFEQLTAFADRHRILWVDLKPLLTTTASDTGAFLRTDTHWRPSTARAIAGEVSAAVRQHWSGIGGPEAKLETLPEIRHEGDLMSFLPLGETFAWLGPDPEVIESYRLRPVDGISAADLFGERSFDVVLIGTSYSANTLWCFADCLEAQLGTAVLNLAEAGRGPLEPMLDLLESDQLKINPPAVVIWEFPERFLGFDYGLPAPEPSAYYDGGEK
jgi:alginate O-acetyltransferase complex protein AlgJ